MYLKDNNKKHKGLAGMEMILVCGVVAVIVLVVVPIILPYVSKSNTTRLYADFGAVYRSTLNGIAEWRYKSSGDQRLEDFSYLDSSDVAYEEYFIYFQRVMPKLHTLDEPFDGDDDDNTWRLVFSESDEGFDTYIYNGEYVSINGGTPFPREELSLE